MLNVVTTSGDDADMSSANTERRNRVLRGG